MRYYLARWEWMDAGGFMAWIPPLADQCIASLDFRSLPQQAFPGGIPERFGFFAYLSAVVIPNSIDLGDGLTINVNNAKKSALKTNLELLSNISATRLVDILWELYTTHADATGLLRWKPLMPKIDNNLELVLNGHSVVKSQKLIPEISLEWNQVIAVYQNDYRKIREQGLQGLHDKDLHRQFLDVLVKKYRLEPNKFIPSDLPKEVPLPHNTIITENFNTADSTTLGPDLSWTELLGDFDVFSNTCRYASALDFVHIAARANTDLSSVNHYAKIILVNANNGIISGQGVMTRKDSTTTMTYYFHMSRHATANIEGLSLYKRVSGTYTKILSLDEAVAVNDILLGRANGSTIELLINDISKLSSTDTAITGNLRCGILMQSTNLANTRPQVDNFEAGDLSLVPIFKRKDKTLIGI